MGLRDNPDPAATGVFLGHVDLGRDAFLDRGDEGDDAVGFAAGLEIRQRRHGDFRGRAGG